MGTSNSKQSWLCSDCSGRLSTLDGIINDLAPVRGVEPIIVDYEITEFECCDEISISSPTTHSTIRNSSNVTVPSPITPTKFRPVVSRTKVISRNASNRSVNIVESIRSSSVLSRPS